MQKAKRVRAPAQINYVGVAKIERIPKTDVYNMEVDGTHCFAVNGGIIVHNCMDAVRYFVQTKRIWRERRDGGYMSVLEGE